MPGDGNLHPLILFDANKPGETERTIEFGDRILELCIEVGGTVTGEHGVGVEKLNAMCTQFGAAELERFHGIKEAFDAYRLLNPGKAVPTLHAARKWAGCTSTTARCRIRTCRASRDDDTMNARDPLRIRPSADDVAGVLAALQNDFGARAKTAAAVREQHGHGEGLADPALPDVVVYPHTNEEVAGIVRLCHAARVPVIPFGVGTSLEGHVAALYGGVCIDLSEMNRVLEVNAADLDCRVQAGVTREQVNPT